MTAFSTTFTESRSYAVTDIEKVMRRFAADLLMIAQSSGSLSESEALKYAHDIERLAEEGYLSKVDITLFSGGVEVRATQFVVNTAAGGLTMSRPGGVMWQKVVSPYLRIILSYTPAYDNAARAEMQPRLKIKWVPSHDDTSHASLSRSGGRDYASNGYGLQRTDFS